MLINELPIRVRYSDTDQMKVVYYAEYFKYFEDGRASLLRDFNFPYSIMEQEYGIYLPVIESYGKFHKSAKFEDLIIVKTFISESPTKMVQFNSAIYKDNLLLVSGYTKHLFVDNENKIVTCPDELRLKIIQTL